MESSLVVLDKISFAKQLAEGLSREHPDQAPWPALLALLESYERKVRAHWPLAAEEREGGRLGWFSVRNIEEVFPQLHEALSDVADSLRHSGE